MRKRSKVIIAVTLAVAALSVTAFAAAAGSDGSSERGASGPSAPSNGPTRVDPPARLMPCGEQSAPNDGPDGSVSYTPCGGDDQPTRPVPTPVEPTPGMDDVHARRWDASSVGDDDTTVTLTYFTGVAPCTQLDHVDVTYGTDTVTITLYEGSDPSAQGTACIDIAMLASTTVHLNQPLGGRTIVDGGLG
jgi:hypothetical protein